MSSLYELPFDQYQRYRLVADLIESLPGSKDFAILDVGGRTALLREFLPKHHVRLVDVDPSDEPGLILGSGAALPFADDSFDVVCAFDTLEHVPVELRDDFVRECARVTRGYVLLAGPYQSPDVQRSEELLQSFLAQKVGAPHRYLNEHRELGLPNRQRVEELFAQAGAQVQTIGHGRLDRWLLSMCLELYLESDPLLQPLGKSFYEFYNRMIYPHDHGDSNYRHVIVGAWQGKPLPSGPAVLGTPKLPQETEVLLGQYAEQILQLDAARTIWEPERQRLVGIIQDLEKDLREHEEALQVANADLQEHKSTLAVSNADLNAHRQTLSAIQKSQAQQQAETQAMRTELEEQMRALREYTEQLEEQNRSWQGRAQASEQHNQEIEAHRTELVTELDKTHRLAGRLNDQLVSQEQAMQALTKEWESVQADLNQRVLELEALGHAAKEDLHRERQEVNRLQALTAKRWSIFKLWVKPKNAHRPPG